MSNDVFIPGSFNMWQYLVKRFNALPNDKILGQFKLKAFADDKINVAENFKFVLERVENMVGKKEKMLVTSILSFSHNVFKRLLLQGR